MLYFITDASSELNFNIRREKRKYKNLLVNIFHLKITVQALSKNENKKQTIEKIWLHEFNLKNEIKDK